MRLSVINEGISLCCKFEMHMIEAPLKHRSLKTLFSFEAKYHNIATNKLLPELSVRLMVDLRRGALKTIIDETRHQRVVIIVKTGHDLKPAGVLPANYIL